MLKRTNLIKGYQSDHVLSVKVEPYLPNVGKSIISILMKMSMKSFPIELAKLQVSYDHYTTVVN